MHSRHLKLHISAAFLFVFSIIMILVHVPDIWQWSELTSYGDLPSPRDFAAASAIGNRKIVMWVFSYGSLIQFFIFYFFVRLM